MRLFKLFEALKFWINFGLGEPLPPEPMRMKILTLLIIAKQLRD